MQVHVWETGPRDAPALVFLHGGGLSGRMWRPQVERLEDQHCLIPDLPEQGQSAHLQPFTLPGAARQVAHLLRERLPGGRAHVIGGGAVALELLRTEPELLQGIFVSGTSAGLGRVLGRLSLASVWLSRFMSPERLVELSARQFGIPAEYLETFREDLLRGTQAPFLRHVTQALMEQQLPRSAPVPVLVAVGQRETLPARSAARRLVANLPGARGVLVPAVGHLWNLQAPDLFTDTVRAWTTGWPLPPRLEPLSHLAPRSPVRLAWKHRTVSTADPSASAVLGGPVRAGGDRAPHGARIGCLKCLHTARVVHCMAPQASPGNQRASPPRTSAWQLALVALALTVFALRVLLPIGGLAFLFSVLVGFFFAQEGLKHVRALEPGPFGGAVYLAGTLLFLLLALGVLLSGWRFIRRMSGDGRPLHVLLRRWWWVFGCCLLLASGFFLSSESGGSAVPGVAGALVLVMAAWGVLSIGYLLWAASRTGLFLAWRLARVSPFGAGLLTVGALSCVGFMLLLDEGLQQLTSRMGKLPMPHVEPVCDTSALECTRQLFLDDSTPSTPRDRGDPLSAARVGTSDWSFPEAPARQAQAGLPEEPESARARQVRECLDSQYKNSDLMEKAWRLAASMINQGDAWDLVHSTLLSVCLRSGERYDFERFFLRSVEYGAYSWLRRPGNVRTCSIETVPHPECGLRPDDQYLQSETQEVVRQVLCSLDSDHRQVLMLRYFDELSDMEIAQRLGISHVAVRKRLQRARKELEDRFLQQCQ